MSFDWLLLIDCIIIAVFMLGIWQFRAPRTARRGNLTAAFALLCAAAVVLFEHKLTEPAVVVLAVLVGASVGQFTAMRVNMLQIPAMVAFQNGAGGIASCLVSFVELTRGSGELGPVAQVSGILGIVIGAVTFSGSMVASAKLAGRIRQTPIIFPHHNALLGAILACIVVLGVIASTTAILPPLAVSLALMVLSLALGVVFAVRVGGADMPVLISFLNATSAIAASFCGITIQNRLLIACGATVAASGSILTHVMCQAMNRRLLKILVASDLKPAQPVARDAATTVSAARKPAARPPLECTVEGVADARNVIIIPGYGMALAHAQFEVVKIANLLQKQGKDVRFAIHPIAGRMPGHMHVLLAEAEADPDMLFDLREINSRFAETDLVLIVGACDVVNPAAIHVEGTPISGMPILLAHEAKSVVVCNLDERPGYSGVDNPLYDNPKTILMFGDAKASLGELLQRLENASD